MPAIGHVVRQPDGTFKGHLTTATIRAPLEIIPVADKAAANHPDYRVYLNSADVGGGWNKENRQNGNPYVSITIDDPVLPDTINANLGRAAGQDDPNVMAIIWNRPRSR